MNAGETKRIIERLKRLGDDDRAFILAWLLRYYEDDGRMRSLRRHRVRSLGDKREQRRYAYSCRKRPAHTYQGRCSSRTVRDQIAEIARNPRSIEDRAAAVHLDLPTALHL
jgi:hypothetical protein